MRADVFRIVFMAVVISSLVCSPARADVTRFDLSGIVTDASGGMTAEAHDMAVRRMAGAGAVPMTWAAVLAEWQRDWARDKTVAGVAGVLAEHGGGSGVAFAWEMQLLAGRAGTGR